MSKQTVIPFGPQHPVLPEPVHLDLVVEDEVVVDAVPQIGYVHRGLEKLVETKDYTKYVYVCERICGICSFGHSYGYSQTVEGMMGIEIPDRAEYLRAIMHELSRIHSHLLWLGLAADAFGFENLFYQCWKLRETVLDIFERTTGGRVILSYCNVGGVKKDIDNSELQGIVQELDKLIEDYDILVKTFTEDVSVRERMCGSGYLSKADADALSVVGPFARASGLEQDVRMCGNGAYGDLAAFEPVLSDGCDNMARVEVRCQEVYQSVDIIKELVSKIPDGEVMVKVKGNPEEGARFVNHLEQPRGECVYYTRGNGTKYLDRFRIRTPTSANLAGLVQILKGCKLADVPLNVLSIDPCISCTER